MRINTEWQDYTLKWGGGEVSVLVRPLTVPALLSLSDALEEIGDSLKTPSGLLRLQQSAAEAFEYGLGGVKGLEVDDGSGVREAAWKDFAEMGQLTAPAVEIAMHLLTLGQLGRDDEKNSDGPVETP